MNWDTLNNRELKNQFHKMTVSKLANKFNTTEEEVILQASRLGLTIWRTSKGAIVTYPSPGVMVHKTY